MNNVFLEKWVEFTREQKSYCNWYCSLSTKHRTWLAVILSWAVIMVLMSGKSYLRTIVTLLQVVNGMSMVHVNLPQINAPWGGAIPRVLSIWGTGSRLSSTRGGWDRQQSFQYRLHRVSYICIWGENQTIVLMGELRDKFLQNLWNSNSPMTSIVVVPYYTLWSPFWCLPHPKTFLLGCQMAHLICLVSPAGPVCTHNKGVIDYDKHTLQCKLQCKLQKQQPRQKLLTAASLGSMSSFWIHSSLLLWSHCATSELPCRVGEGEDVAIIIVYLYLQALHTHLKLHDVIYQISWSYTVPYFI